MRPRVFVVEDEAVIAMDLRERLIALGYDVCGIATHGESAVQEIAELRPDLVLMDVKLAGPMDGVDVAKTLCDTCDVPIVFLTAYANSPLIARATRTNAYGYLVKPFEERELKATLQVALARHAVDRELRQQVTIDSLTGLHNRRFLDEMLLIEINRARRDGQALSLVMIDIDKFKELNDVHGHDAGDRVLQSLGYTLRGAVRASDLACRYGGDEFVLVMPGVDASSAMQKMRSIRAAVRKEAIVYRGAHLTFTLSAGVAEFQAPGASPESLLREADAALYRAKQAGRDQVRQADRRSES